MNVMIIELTKQANCEHMLHGCCMSWQRHVAINRGPVNDTHCVWSPAGQLELLLVTNAHLSSNY